jgi:very-short-patch-repair endonuclease
MKYKRRSSRAKWKYKIAKQRLRVATYSRKFKQQRKLYKLIKAVYPEAVMEYPVDYCSCSKTFFLDIAVPSLKINYEYDGKLYHLNKNKDEYRDKILTSLGWKVIRIDNELLNKIEQDGI